MPFLLRTFTAGMENIMNNTTTGNTVNKTIAIDQHKFFDLYFKSEERFEKLIRNLIKYASAAKALIMFDKGYETRTMAEYGIEYFEKRYKDALPACMKELCTLSTISKVLYGESMVIGRIDTRNVEECYDLMDDIIDAFFNNIGVDLSNRNDLWKIIKIRTA